MGVIVQRESGQPKTDNEMWHYEQVRIRGKWKCVACGKLLTISESIQNSLELSEVTRAAIESRRPLHESLDEVLGRREWEEILAKIPRKEKRSKRGKDPSRRRAR